MARTPPNKGKLSKQEIVEILERNFELYQAEPDFIKYLIELAFYLIQFQYDPDKPPPEPKPDTAEAEPVMTVLTDDGATVITLQSKFVVASDKPVCPFCGSQINKNMRCSTCGLVVT